MCAAETQHRNARAAAGAASDDPCERLRVVALAVADQRGLSKPVADEGKVVAPYRTLAIAEADRLEPPGLETRERTV